MSVSTLAGAPATLPALQTASNKTGSHTHVCNKNYHQFTCQYTSSCSLELLVQAQARINELCPGCHNLYYGPYAS